MAFKKDIKKTLGKQRRNLSYLLKKFDIKIDLFGLNKGSKDQTFQLLETPIAASPMEQSELQNFVDGLVLAVKEYVKSVV